MKVKELRELPLDELKQKHSDFESKLFQLRMSHSQGQYVNSFNIKRREIAMVKTIINEKLKNQVK